MAENSRPWNGTVTGDAGPYSDADWQELYRYIIGLGANRNNVGVFLGSGTSPDDGLGVYAQSPVSTVIDVYPGSALVQGIAYINDDVEPLTVAANASGNPRIDTVILRADYALQTVRLVLKQGTPAASPVAPTLTQTPSVMWELPLANIAVANGFVSISQSNITSRREWINAGSVVYLDNVLNNSGGELIDGDVVIWDSTADRAATTTTTRDSKVLAGAWRGTTANGAYGRVQIEGIGYVRADSAVTRGNLLTTGTTAKSATIPGTLQAVLNACLGVALETTTGAGLVLTRINVQVVNNTDFVLVQDQKANTVAGQALTSSTWNVRALTAIVTDTGSIASLGSNQITLPRGRYSVVGHSSSGANIGTHRLRLRDVSNNVTLLLGNSALNNSGVVISGVFDLAASTNIELQHWNTVNGSGGLASSSGELEVYSSLRFTRHGQTA